MFRLLQFGRLLDEDRQTNGSDGTPNNQDLGNSSPTMMIGEDATNRADDATNECAQPWEPEDVRSIRIGHCFESPRATVTDTIEWCTTFDEDTIVGVVITCIVLEILVVTSTSRNISEQISDQLLDSVVGEKTIMWDVVVGNSNCEDVLRRRIYTQTIWIHHVPLEMHHWIRWRNQNSSRIGMS